MSNVIDYLKDTFRNYKIIIIYYITSVLLFSPIWVNGYTNAFDGLWKSSNYQAGNFELASGRWAWLFMDKLRGAYATDPLNSLLALLLIAIGTYLFLVLFDKSNKIIIYGLLVVCSTTIASYLTYTFQSPCFGMSFLLAAIATHLLVIDFQDIKYRIIRCITVAICVNVLLGLYQANIGCMCLAITVYMIYMLLINRKPIEVYKLMGRSLFDVAVGCVSYKIVWDMAMKFRGAEASTYLGAGSVSMSGIIFNIPRGILNAYKAFLYYFSYEMGHYIAKPIRIFIAVAIIICLAVRGIKVRGIKEKLTYYFLVVMIPVVTNVYCLLAPEAGELRIHMSGPLNMIIPLLGVILVADMSAGTIKRWGLIGLAAVYLYGSIYSVGFDMDALRQGYTVTHTIVDSVKASLIKKDLYSRDYEYALVGNAYCSPLFVTNDIWQDSTDYARFGEFINHPGSIMDSYKGVLDDMGINMAFPQNEVYEALCQDKDILEMPVYPDEGSIVLVDGIVVIKISDELGE